LRELLNNGPLGPERNQFMSTNTSFPSNLANYRCQVMAIQPHPLKSLDSLAVLTTCHRGQEICGETRPAEHWYCVISGAARRCVLRADGRRQIVGLLLPGDFFGFTAGDEYDYTVEAVVEGTVVTAYSRRRIEALADLDPQVARELRQVAFDALARLQSQLLMLGRITVIEKVSSFILEMARRLRHGRDDSVALPISRYDIADYLAVSVETVSRSLTNLKRRGVIKFSGTRTLKIVDRDALEEGECEYRFAPRRVRHYSLPGHRREAPLDARPATTASRMASAS
jgi:CRP/FNR family transcriptional regulator, nitrogen fixation regulation protein